MPSRVCLLYLVLDQVNTSWIIVICTGELPLELIRMKVKGIIPHETSSSYSGLHGNKGFTLPSNIGELGDITELDFMNCSLQGASCSTSAYTERS